MEIPLILAAQTYQLAPDLEQGIAVNGVQAVKNASSRTYLTVTKAQWRMLELFAEPRTVPAVLALALESRSCLPLGEFYELVLKAVRENLLIEPGAAVKNAPIYGWRLGVRPAMVIRPLAVLLFTGVFLAFAFQTSLPDSLADAFAGLLAVSAALSLGSVLAACIVHGAGGEVRPLPWHWWRLPPHFAVETHDVVMLPLVAQQAAAMALPACLAAAAGILAWQKPDWSFIPLVALAFSLRPILGGRFAALVRFSRSVPLSDAEHDFIFPPNHRPQLRWAALRRAIRHPDTWARLAYGVVWTLALIYLGARLTDTPPWTMAFWETNGFRVAVAIGGSLATLGTLYVASECYILTREYARSRRRVLRKSYRRWFGGSKLVLGEAERAKAVNESPLFRLLPPPDRQQLARLMQVTHHRVWRALPDYGPVPTKVSLIVSGKIGLYRKAPSGQLRRVQVLSEGDLVGLHDIADQRHPEYHVRSLTPVTLLTVDRATADTVLLPRLPRPALENLVLKLSFLRRIPLCQNWHHQAVERFAALSVISDIPAGSVILAENQFNQDFFVIFENEAVVSRNGQRVASLRSGDFFGEIGLLQNSAATAQVSTKHTARSLSIDRLEFMRFVTHNYSVALELERVSSRRLGHPIFPLKKGNFRAT